MSHIVVCSCSHTLIIFTFLVFLSVCFEKQKHLSLLCSSYTDHFYFCLSVFYPEKTATTLSVLLVVAVTRSAREKEKLANIMAYGEDVDKIPLERVRRRLATPPPDPDRFDECG